MWLSYLRVFGALSVTLLSGSYYFVQLSDTCGPTAFRECISQRIAQPHVDKADKRQRATINPDGRAARGAMWPQIPASEEMLIWSGHLDGEVGRIASVDFEKSVKAYQATLAPGMPGEEQRAALQKHASSIRSGWRFEKESDPEAAELWLPRKLLPSRQELSHGSQYASIPRDFIVDVAEWDTTGLTIERVKQIHCCKPTRKLEGPIVDTADAGGPGFMLSARDGQQRVSVRAQQRDGVIRILAIAYETERDKEFRVLRNAIASSYIAFAPAQRRDDRLTSCSRSDNDRCADRTVPDATPWDRRGPL
jgi:hypothetical protein